MNPVEIVETYLSELRLIHASGAAVRETSYYAPLSTLLNAVGDELSPKVRCIINIRNQGAGLPDGGFFTPDQFQEDALSAILEGQIPARGVVEVKGAGDSVTAIAASEQVRRYLVRYGQVLVTNYRDFLLVTRDATGNPSLQERYTLAESDQAFWLAAATPTKMAVEHGTRLVDYLQRAMRRAASLTTPHDVAWFLASYAREALARIENAELPALAAVRHALEEALGITIEGRRGEHFFRSTLVQTLFYGIFSAWVLWSKQQSAGTPTARFDWRTAAWSLRVPILRKLYHELTEPGQIDALGLAEVLEWAGDALNRVDPGEFFSRFEEGHAVQYFYEPFLQAFDPELRKELGVWYTPPEIVQYMVARVDTALRTELGIADGLADPRVYVLDPCCGTGAYLVAVIQRIAATLRTKQGDALGGYDLKRAATERIFGFELLPAPFVVAHLQIGLLLQNLNAPLSTNERAGVYLTNALTGWEPPRDPQRHLTFPELEEERDAAEAVKREKPILVILGNPPYNGYAGIAVAEERALSTAYRTTKRAPAPQGQGLNDLYVRFFRMAEHRIVEGTQKGIVCFISNYSWLDGLSFTGMRERYLEVFDHIWIDNLHGDRIISEYAPDGRTSETIFAMQGTSPGIKVGTAIALLLCSGNAAQEPIRPLYRDLAQARASDRRAALIASLKQEDITSEYIPLEPVIEIGLPLKPQAMGDSYLTWPLLPQLFPGSFPGVKTSRDEALVDIDKQRLVGRIQRYFDASVSNSEIQQHMPAMMQNTARFPAEATRAYLCRRGLLPDKVVRYYYRPFDVRWLYWEPETKLLDEKRTEYFPHISEDNLWIAAAQRHRKDFDPPVITRHLCSLHVDERGANLYPLRLRISDGQDLFSQGAPEESFNLSKEAERYLSEVIDAAPYHLFLHTLAILYAPAYRAENAGALRQDWPRIPLPASRDALLASAALGQRLTALLDVETSVPGVSEGEIRPALRPLAPIARVGGGQLIPAAGDLAVTAGWGHSGKGGVTMPARGKYVERSYTTEELQAMGDGATLLGETTGDVYLNEIAYWSNVPRRVWEYTIGGYQVMKKWLSYREQKLLGRPLQPEEVRAFTEIARRIAAIILLEPELDANYHAVKSHPYPWSQQR